MSDDSSITAVFVDADGSGAITGPVSFRDSRFSLEPVEPLKNLTVLRGGRVRKKVLVVDIKSLNSRSFNPYLKSCSKISGSEVWLMETIANEDDLMDAFLGDMTKIIFPVHSMERGFTLEDVEESSDSCIPAVICVNGKPLGGRPLMDVVEDTRRAGFPNVVVMDCDGSVDDETWSNLVAEHPGAFIYSPARSSIVIRSANVTFETTGTYSPQITETESCEVMGRAVKAVVFDIDGTLISTQVDYSRLDRAAYDYLTSIGVPGSVLTPNDNAATLKSGYEWLRSNGRGSEIDAVEKTVGDHLTAIEIEHSAEAAAVPGITECIQNLKGNGYKVGALTRGGREYAEHIMRGADLLSLMDVLVARDDHPYTEGKPNRLAMDRTAAALGVQTSEVLFVGDSATDWNTAVAAGCPFIGVTTGHMTTEKWREIAGDDVTVLHSAADVLSVLADTYMTNWNSEKLQEIHD